MIVAAQAAGAQVLLVGMKLPPNYGPAYVREFDALFDDGREVAQGPFVPYVFAGFGDDLALSSPTASIRRPRRSRGCSTTYGRRCAPARAKAK